MGGLENDSDNEQSATAKSVTAVEPLLREYFVLKDRDKAIRRIRNEYMQTHKCLNALRPSSDFKDQSDYEANGGECIHKTVGMGGYPAPLCEVCEKRNGWYTERQQLSHRRSAIMRKLKRLVAVTDLEPSGAKATTGQANPPIPPPTI